MNWSQCLKNMPEEMNKMPSRKPFGYWKDFENIKSELNKIKQKLGHFPRCYREIEEHSGKGITSSIREYHGNLKIVAEKMGYNVENKYLDINVLIKELNHIKEQNKLKTIPSEKKLESLGFYNLTHWIKYHGGYNVVRENAGEIPRVERGKWKDRNYIIKKAKEFKKKNKFKELPNSHKLEEMGYSSLASAIRIFGYTNIRRILGEKSSRNPRGIWKSLEYTLKITRQLIIDENIEELPSPDKLKSMNCSLYHAIYRYHGGYKVFREKLNVYLGKPSNNFQLESMLEKYAGGGI